MPPGPPMGGGPCPGGAPWLGGPPLGPLGAELVEVWEGDVSDGEVASGSSPVPLCAARSTRHTTSSVIFHWSRV